MGGRIWVESVLGKGSKFHVQLDLPVSEKQVHDFSPDKNNTEEVTRVFHVLVVDDEESNTNLVKYRLEAEGHSAETASNGEEALEAFQRESYDAIIMDVRMPVMDGLTATKKLRKLEQEQGINPEQ